MNEWRMVPFPLRKVLDTRIKGREEARKIRENYEASGHVGILRLGQLFVDAGFIHLR